jgi:hypothetical protein
VVSRAAKLLGYRFQGSLANFLSPTTEVGWPVLGLRPAGTRGGRSGSKEVWEHKPEVVGMPFAHADGGGIGV